MITIHNLSVAYTTDEKTRQNKTVLADIGLSLSAGTVNIVIGPSGGGKSTLLKVIAGLIDPSAGTVKLGGADGCEPIIGFMPQSCGLLPWETIRENVELAAGLRLKKTGASAADCDNMKKQSLALMKQLGIDALADCYPSEVSGGQQQRAALGRMFLLRPDLLLMDEPFSALDELTRGEVRQLFAALCAGRRQDDCKPMTVLMVTHQVEEAVLLGEKIIVLDGKIKAVLDNPYRGQSENLCPQERAEFIVRLRRLLDREGGSTP